MQPAEPKGNKAKKKVSPASNQEKRRSSCQRPKQRQLIPVADFTLSTSDVFSAPEGQARFMGADAARLRPPPVLRSQVRGSQLFTRTQKTPSPSV